MREYFLETDRLLFSYWAKEDINLASLLWGDKKVVKYISKAGQFSEQEIYSRLDLEINNKKQFGVQYWPVFEKATNEFIGCCGFRPYNAENNIEKNIYELGFHLRPEYWGKGFGTEAAYAVMKFAFNALNATEVIAGHNPDNFGSKRVLEKLGFKYTGDKYYEPTGLYHAVYIINQLQC